ncbi:MAG: penicillin-binding protein 2 [Pyrinomonadaceae bacterium]
MKIGDHVQNLGARVGTIQVLAFILLGVLGARLYYLQVVKGEYYTDRAESQRVRFIPIPAPRGAILDRHGKMLVDSRPTYNVVLSNEPLKTVNVAERVDDYSRGLNLDRQFVVERLSLIKQQNEFEAMVLKENADVRDITWVEAHSLEFPELRVELQPQRFYPLGAVLAHVLGYVGEISPKQLEDPLMQERGFRPGDIIGKGGLEQYYDEYLRGRPGYRKVLVDSRGRVQSELDVVQPQSGQDMVTTIDLDVQIKAEEQLSNSITKRGTIIAMDPNNGQMLAMASAPSFDPNIFVRGSSTPEGRKAIAAYWQDEKRPLFNRAIQGRYPPGSTWKIPESIAGLQQGAITVAQSNLVCGGGIQVGNKFTRCMGSHGSPNLSYAITKSCDGYYYRLALKMKIEGVIQMIETYGYDKRSGIDLPNEKVPQTPKSWMPWVIKNEGKWSDIRTVYSGIGQDTVWVTPISMLRAVASIGMRGQMYVPHFLKEFRPIAAVGTEGKSDFFAARVGFGFQNAEPKLIEAKEDQWDLVVKGMWGVVNGGGTGAGIRIPDYEIAGKTGTAQVAELGKDVGDKKDHAWFVSFAPAYKPEIAVIALIENVGFGGSHAAPAAKGVYEAFRETKGHITDSSAHSEAPDKTVALPKPDSTKTR